MEEEAEEQPPGMMEEEEEELPHQAEEQPPAIMEEEEASPQAGGQAATAPSRRAGQKAGRRKARRGQGLLTQGQVQGPLPLTALALDSLLAEAEAQQQPEGGLCLSCVHFDLCHTRCMKCNIYSNHQCLCSCQPFCPALTHIMHL